MSDLIKTNFNYFYIKNFTGVYSTSSYSLPITPFTFLPTGVTDIGKQYSNKKFLWDFGDSTTSKSVTATHWYSLPGSYTVTLYLIDALGNGVIDSFKQTVDVYDYIPDNFVVSTSGTWINESSHFDNYFTISRFNSWRNYDKFVVDGYKFNLYAENTNAPLLDVKAYESQTYSHLLPYAGFFQRYWNAYINDYEKVPASTVTTTSVELYCKLSGSQIINCVSTDFGSCFAGTSGIADVYFVDDFTSDNIATIFISPDNINLSDYTLSEGGFDNKLTKSKYQVIQQIPKNIFYKTVPQGNVDNISITSNGIPSFTIDTNQFVGTRIPFVVRLQDADNFPVKYLNILTLLSGASTLSAHRIDVDLICNGSAVSGVTVTADFGNLTATSLSGGYFKGYIECLTECENAYVEVSLFADETYEEISQVWVLQPESKYIHSTQFYSDLLVNTQQLTGASAVAKIPDGPENGSAWVVDADIDKIVKYSITGTLLSSFSLSAMQLSGGGTVNLLGALSSAAPSYVALDGNKDVWVTLFDAVSTIKINQSTGKIDAVAVPQLTNTFLSDISSYNALSGFAGDNSLTPSCVDTDSQNNIWVTYNNPISSYIIKYTTTGSVLSTIAVPAGYSADTLVVDKNDDVWVVYKNYLLTVSALTDYDDNIKLINNQTGAISAVTVGGYIGDVTLDTLSNIWFTQNKNTIVKLVPSTLGLTSYTLSSSPNNATNYLSDMEGIGGVDDNNVFVINTVDKLIYNFKPSVTTIVTVSAVPDLTISSGENKLFAVGDWTGSRWLVKYVIESTLVGASNTFNINPATGKYSIGKINENVDFTEMYKSYIFQEALMDKPILFDDFIGTIVGNIDSSSNSLGKRVYEKIANFVDNTYNPQTCNIPALVGLYQQFGQNMTQFDQSKFAYPADMARLLDLFSIKQSKLWGARNVTAENYDKRGTVNSDTYGINLGDKLDFFTTILTAGSASTPIVAYEKFSEKYKLLNTDVLSGNYSEFKNVALQTYALSTYSNYWGWGLVLPSDYTLDELDKSYIFYDYIPTPAGNQVEGTINWDDSLTTISENLSSQADWQGIMENMLTYQLFKGMKLFTSAVDVDN